MAVRRIHPKTWDDGVMPLEEFPEEKRALIERQIAAPTPPQRWLRLQFAEIESRAWWEWHWVRGKKLHRIEIPGVATRRRHIPKAVRRFVYQRDGFACLHCGSTDRLSLDHIRPWSLGGSDDIDNLQTLCRPCNSRKGARI